MGPLFRVFVANEINKNRFGECAGKKNDERANPFIEENRLMTARTQAPSEKEHFH